MARECSRKPVEVCYDENMDSAHSTAPLQRQVLPPQKADRSLAVLIVASTAMFFAVLSLSLIHI